MSPPIRTIIIDDEPLARSIIKSHLRRFQQIQVVGEADNGFAGLKMINETCPELVFLDIRMPQLTGLEMLHLVENPPAIVFTTAYDQYAVNAFDLQAVDYLLKPFSAQRFDAAMRRVLDYIAQRRFKVEEQKKVLEDLESGNDALLQIPIKNGAEMRLLTVREILRIEANEDYVRIHTREETLLHQSTMKFFEERLPGEQFLRIHRSHLVRRSIIKAIRPLTRDSYQAILTNGDVLPVSKSGYQRLRSSIE